MSLSKLLEQNIFELADNYFELEFKEIQEITKDEMQELLDNITYEQSYFMEIKDSIVRFIQIIEKYNVNKFIKDFDKYLDIKNDDCIFNNFQMYYKYINENSYDENGWLQHIKHELHPILTKILDYKNYKLYEYVVENGGIKDTKLDKYVFVEFSDYRKEVYFKILDIQDDLHYFIENIDKFTNHNFIIVYEQEYVTVKDMIVSIKTLDGIQYGILKV